MVSLLQTYGRESQATSYSWIFETTCPESPYPSQSVGTGQYCSAGTSVGYPENGYHKDSDGQLKPTMTDDLPAPKAIIEMVSCHCKTDCSSCRTNNLSCTDLCRCDSECQNDEETQNKHETDDDDDDDDF